MGKLLGPTRALAASQPSQGSEPDFRARTCGQSQALEESGDLKRLSTGPASGSGMEVEPFQVSPSGPGTCLPWERPQEVKARPHPGRHRETPFRNL